MASTFKFTEFSKQSPRGILVIYFRQLYSTIKITWILIFFALKDFSKITQIGDGYVYATLIVLLLVYLVRAYLIYQNFQFKVDENHFILKHGIFSKVNISIPFDRIQNINFKQNLIQQLINVHEVSIETAGSSQTEITIKALDLKKAQALKQLIFKRNKTKGDNLLVEDEKPLLRISPLELFKVSLTENHLKNLFFFILLLVGFFQQIQQIADSFGETDKLDGFIEESSNAITPNIIIILTLVSVLTIIAFVTSFVRVFLTHFNLTTFQKKNSFEINQGLFTKKSIVLKKKKVQSIVVSTNPLKRLIGISFITFKQAVSGQVNTKKNKVIKIVGCKKNQVDVVRTSLYTIDEIEQSDKKYPANYYAKRVYIYNFLFLIIGYGALFFLLFDLNSLLSILLVIPLMLFLIRKKLRKRFYKISNNYLLLGSGLIETHLAYLELFKVQNIKLKQSYFQQRRNVADIVLQTASGKITLPCLSFSEASKLYNYILFKVEKSTKEWM